jgi:hypothetical protein
LLQWREAGPPVGVRRLLSRFVIIESMRYLGTSVHGAVMRGWLRTRKNCHRLVKDYGRLEGLLQWIVAQAGTVDQRVYDQFRAGSLRHIGMEEKLLLPAA